MMINTALGFILQANELQDKTYSSTEICCDSCIEQDCDNCKKIWEDSDE